MTLVSVVRDKDDKTRKSMHNKEKRFQNARTGFAYCCLFFYCLVLSYNYCFLDLALGYWYLKKKIKPICWPWKHEKTALKSCSYLAKIFFSVFPTGPKPTQISNIFHRNLPLPNYIYNDFVCMLSNIKKHFVRPYLNTI